MENQHLVWIEEYRPSYVPESDSEDNDEDNSASKLKNIEFKMMESSDDEFEFIDLN